MSAVKNVKSIASVKNFGFYYSINVFMYAMRIDSAILLDVVDCTNFCDACQTVSQLSMKSFARVAAKFV